LVFTTNTASIVGGATAAMYVSYVLVTVVVLWSLLRGWPKKRAYFNLGRWNLVVTIVAFVGTGFTAANLLWPRASTNPSLDEINGVATDSMLRHIPMGWYLVGVPIIIGVIYYLVRQRKIDAAVMRRHHRSRSKVALSCPPIGRARSCGRVPVYRTDGDPRWLRRSRRPCTYTE
jgi:cytochrome bd-type quinol oxidase subunit 2